MSSLDLALPTARSKGLVVENLGDETLIYDLESDELHHLNPTAAAVFVRCDGQTTSAELASGVAQRLGEPVSAEAVREAVEQLAERGLLTQAPSTGPGVSRREVVRKAAVVGAGAAVAGPVIKSIVAPTPAMAQSGECVPVGESCQQISDCCDCDPSLEKVCFNGQCGCFT
jgi:hypothetical protein